MFDLNEAEQFKRGVRASFDATPSDYGSKGDFHWQFAQRLIDRTPLRSHEVILDIATGTAPAAIIASSRLGSQAILICRQPSSIS